MKLLRQILFDFKAQPVIGIVSVIGTALAILLVMTVTIVYDTDTIAVAPESARQRLLYDKGMYLRSDGNSMANSLSLRAIDRLYRGLDTPAAVAAVSSYIERRDVTGDNGASPVMADTRTADANVWKVFDYTFISGTPFTDADVDARRDVAVISESVARSVFSTPDATGRTIRVKGRPYTVRGVVEDVTPLMKLSYAGVWLPAIDSGYTDDYPNAEWMGGYTAVILAETPADLPAIRREALAANAAFNRELALGGYARVDCGAPYTHVEFTQVHGSNNPPMMDVYYQVKYILLAIFMIVPAINLSSMTQSRLRRRRHEIGVRRAFGATRMGVMGGILRENLVVTLLGGALGLLLSMVMVWLFTDMLFEMDYWDVPSAPLEMTWRMLLRPGLFGWALLFCFVLNLLSAGIPALRASRVNPVEAINHTEK